jgi:hypothetical protein
MTATKPDCTPFKITCRCGNSKAYYTGKDSWFLYWHCPSCGGFYRKEADPVDPISPISPCETPSFETLSGFCFGKES